MINSHLNLPQVGVGSLEKPGLEVTNTLVYRDVCAAEVRRHTVPSSGSGKTELQGPIFLVYVYGTIRLLWAAEQTMVCPATV